MKEYQQKTPIISRKAVILRLTIENVFSPSNIEDV